jgi:Ca2+/Na+ antiporter
MLYKHGEGDPLSKHLKFIVAVVCISIAYLLLSLSAQVNWIGIVVVISLVVVVLIIYSTYQIVGLYYSYIFKENKEEAKSPEY